MHGITGFKSGSGTSDNDLIFGTLVNMETYNTFEIMSTAGAMDVFVSIDGTNFTTSAHSLADLGATTSDPVVVTAANRLYGFKGKFAAIQVRQNGGTAVVNASIRYGVM
ncbi:MAG: hypothetical protein RL651_1793 [Pseudomonadota bacterium]|jgi:hypothetical protein